MIKREDVFYSAPGRSSGYYRVVSILVLLSAILLISGPRCAQAVPAFARQYKTECSTCHTIIPERNEFGEAFEKNSFVWPKEASAKKESAAPSKPVEEWLLLSNMPEQVPLSFVLGSRTVYNSRKVPETELGSSTTFQGIAAGSLRETAGFYASTSFNGDSSNVWIQLRKPASLPLNVKAGMFLLNESIWKDGNKVYVGSNLFESAKVGKNPWALNSHLKAVEVNSVVGNRVFIAAGVAQSPNASETAAQPAAPPSNHKDVYGSISYRLFGTDFLGREPDIDLDKASSITDYLSLTFNGYYYDGTNLATKATATAVAKDNDFKRYGAEFDILYRNLHGRLGAYWGKDDNPTFLTSGGLSTRSYATYVQGEYFIGPKICLSLRYDNFDQGIDNNGNKPLVARQYAPSLTYAPWQNVILATEYTVSVHKSGTELTDRQTIFSVRYSM